jgi:hypothetical protein
MKKALRFSETLVLTRATRRIISEDTILLEKSCLHKNFSLKNNIFGERLTKKNQGLAVCARIARQDIQTQEAISGHAESLCPPHTAGGTCCRAEVLIAFTV